MGLEPLFETKSIKFQTGPFLTAHSIKLSEGADLPTG